ncbi:MAG: NAD(P)H-hydrate dehydratase, partial [Clostridia bacterium]|nr:NAD(P)H-hydrate dehydratase [Clostridia bacterium]
GTAGRVFIIGGCGGMIGAPLMSGAAAHAAYLSGAGTVTVCLPSVHRAAASSRATMAMMKFLPDTRDGFIKFDKPSLDAIIFKAVAIDIGMGMGDDPELKSILEYLSKNFGGALVIDADALNAIKLDYAFLKDSKAKIILTPHVGEFERLTGKPATIENAAALAREIGGTVVLKSATTAVTDGNRRGYARYGKGRNGRRVGRLHNCAFLHVRSVRCGVHSVLPQRYRCGAGGERVCRNNADRTRRA